MKQSTPTLPPLLSSDKAFQSQIQLVRDVASLATYYFDHLHALQPLDSAIPDAEDRYRLLCSAYVPSEGSILSVVLNSSGQLRIFRRDGRPGNNLKYWDPKPRDPLVLQPETVLRFLVHSASMAMEDAWKARRMDVNAEEDLVAFQDAVKRMRGFALKYDRTQGLS